MYLRESIHMPMIDSVVVNESMYGTRLSVHSRRKAAMATKRITKSSESRDGYFRTLLCLASEPDDEAVDTSKEIVDLHAAVGIDTSLIEHYDVYGRHDAPHDPHPNGGSHFEDEVYETEDGAEGVERMCCDVF